MGALDEERRSQERPIQPMSVSNQRPCEFELASGVPIVGIGQLSELLEIGRFTDLAERCEHRLANAWVPVMDCTVEHVPRFLRADSAE